MGRVRAKGGAICVICRGEGSRWEEGAALEGRGDYRGKRRR